MVSTPDFELFSGIPPAVVASTLARLPRHPLAAGDVVLREGAANDRVILVERGELEAWKGEPGTPAGVLLASLPAGACFGEIAAGDPAAASVTLRAACSAEIRLLRRSDLPDDPAVRERVSLNLARALLLHLADAHTILHDKHEREADAVGRAAAASAFITRMLVALACYMLSLPLIEVITPLLPSNSLVSFFFIATFSWVVVNYKAHHPDVVRRHWYMTLREWPTKLFRGVLWTVPPLLVFLAIKLSFMAVRGPTLAFVDPMEAIKPGAPMNWPVWGAFAVVYTVLCFVQEFVRCAVQGTLEAINVPVTRGGHWKAILIADVVFASIHVHLGGSFAAQAFIGGLFFGYEFYRERSYFAVAVSHALVGFITVFVLGVPR